MRGADRPDSFDPRLRTAADIYDIGLTKAFQVGDGPRVELTPGPQPLPFGSIDVALPDEQLRWGDRRLVGFVAASELRVIGLRNRYRQAGIGAPLAAKTAPLDADKALRDFIFPAAAVPVTAVLRIADVSDGIASGHLQATLELSPRVRGTRHRRRRAPGAARARAHLRPRVGARWLVHLEPRAPRLRFGDLSIRENQMRLGGLEPYRPDRIPVVFVHGTASSPGRWAEMLNDLLNDRRIRERFQFWAFIYDTGIPSSTPACCSASRSRTPSRASIPRATTHASADGRDRPQPGRAAREADGRRQRRPAWANVSSSRSTSSRFRRRAATSSVARCS
jgi:hypothetical protein